MCISLSLPLSPALTLLFLSFSFETLFPSSQPHPSLYPPQPFSHGWFSSLWFVWSALRIPTLFSSRPNMFHTVRGLFMKLSTLCYSDHCFYNFFFCLKYYEICWRAFADHCCVQFSVCKMNVCLCKLEHTIVCVGALQTFLIVFPYS